MRRVRFGLIPAFGLIAVLVGAGSGIADRAAGAVGPVVTVPTSIDATGERDVTGELNQFFAGVAPGSTIRFPNRGRFRVENVVLIDAQSNLTIEGNDSIFMAMTDGSSQPVPFRNFRNRWPRMREHVEIRRSRQIAIRDLAIVGPNSSGRYEPDLEAQAGFVVSASAGVTLDGVTVRGTFGDGVYIVGQSSDVTITGCTLDRNGRQGVAVVAGRNITVTNCAISDTGRSAIDLEPARGQVQNVHITDNRVTNPTNFLLAAVGAGVGVQDVWLERNRVDGGKGVSVYVGTARSRRTGMHILDNVGTGVSSGYEGTLLRFERFDGIEVRGNRQRVAAGVTPIRLINSCNETVRGNDFGPADPMITREGDCSTPIPLGRRNQGGAANQPGGARPGRGSTTTTATVAVSAPPSTAPPVGTDESDNGLAIVLALGVGLLAGVGVTLGFQRVRRASSGPAERPEPDAH